MKLLEIESNEKPRREMKVERDRLTLEIDDETDGPYVQVCEPPADTARSLGALEPC